VSSAEKKKPKLCMFCGKDESYGPMNKEHFVPRGLWAGPRPSGTRTCPAHSECNQNFAEDNDYFRLVIASDEDSRPHDEAQRVLDGPVTKIMVESPGRYLRHAKDFAFRSRFSLGGVYLGEQGCFPIDFARIDRVLQNVVKGLFYTVTGKPLGQDRDILVYDEEGARTEAVDFFQSRMSEWYDFGDQVFTWRHVFMEGLENIACTMQFYRRKLFFAVTNLKESAEQRLGKNQI
jgi:hypothetical protein